MINCTYPAIIGLNYVVLLSLNIALFILVNSGDPGKMVRCVSFIQSFTGFQYKGLTVEFVYRIDNVLVFLLIFWFLKNVWVLVE